MEQVSYKISLDTMKNGVQRVIQGINTGDIISRTIEISLVCGNETYELPLDNIIAEMYVTAPSATEPSINECQIVGNKIVYELLQSDMSEAGTVDMQLKLIETRIGGAQKVLISPRFALDIWESTTDDSQAEDEPIFTSLENALARAEEAYNARIVSAVITPSGSEKGLITITYADGTVYTSTVIKDAIDMVAQVGEYKLATEGMAYGTQDGVPVESGSPYYQNNAEYYSEQASLRVEEAQGYADDASDSASDASTSASNAATSELNASNSASDSASSATEASESADSASASATSAATSASNASASATSASTSASSASSYAQTALSHSNTALSYANNASSSANNASASATDASESATSASESAQEASGYSSDAEDSAILAESYTKGGTGVRPGEDLDNCLYYKNLCESYSVGGLVPNGTVTFAELESQTKKTGYMYNITDDFVTTANFKEGAGIPYPSGTNVYWTVDELWDCLAGTSVIGVKGNAETNYRRGNVNITKANIGLGNVDNTADADKSVAEAVKATQDGDGNNISDTYATKTELTDGSVTKLGTQSVGNSSQPMYLNNGVPTACQYKVEIVSTLPANPDSNTFYVIV